MFTTGSFRRVILPADFERDAVELLRFPSQNGAT
jgi:hypothetical protein